MNPKPEAIRPAELEYFEEKNLRVLWQDGHRSVYPFVYLRRQCRCAGCIDEWSGQMRLDPKKISEDIKPLQTAPVGNYGIRFDWSDGHSTGIYAFESLRSICPCEDCKSKRGQSLP